MKVDSRTKWWRDCAAAFGPEIMDNTLRGDSEWGAILANGRQELAKALALTEMRIGRKLLVLEVGCGMGRLTAALAEQYGFVCGIDVSPKLIDRARAWIKLDNVRFEVCDGRRVRPSDPRPWDVVFSYEVLHYVERDTVATYFQDIYSLLRPGGQFVFELNTVPIRLRTRATVLLRIALNLLGVRKWHGWPTAPGFHRNYHSVPSLQTFLANAGFRIDRLIDGNPAQTWFVATKAALPSEPLADHSCVP
jgi:SAM-dependent methyltransferase